MINECRKCKGKGETYIAGSMNDFWIPCSRCQPENLEKLEKELREKGFATPDPPKLRNFDVKVDETNTLESVALDFTTEDDPVALRDEIKRLMAERERALEALTRLIHHGDRFLAWQILASSKANAGVNEIG